MAIDLEVLDRKAAADDEINWVTAIFMGLFHVGAIAALFFFTWKAFLVSMFLWWVSGSLGIGMGYHRLLTHRGYKTPKWVEYVLTTCATLALEGGPIFWVATHRIHHQHSDQEGDPHSPRDGKWWAHMGWILTGKSMHHDTTTLARYVPDLAKDKFHVWITKYHYVPMIVLGVVLFAIGGLPFLLWGARSAMKQRLEAAADSVIAEYRNNDAPAVYEAQWKDAKEDLGRALEIDPDDRGIKGRYRLCEAHLERIAAARARPNARQKLLNC